MTDPHGAALVLEGGTVLVGRNLEAERLSIVVEEGLITALSPPSSEVPPSATKVDVSGSTLTPGFIDAHVHIGFYEPREVLHGGVTTVRDLAWPPDRLLPLAEASLQTGFDGPEILFAGPMLTAPGGYPTRAGWAPPGTGRELPDLASAETAVDELAQSGVSVIKVALNEATGPTLPAHILTAIVRRAHGLGLKVTGHVTGSRELNKAIAAGMDELAHMLKGLDTIPDDVLHEMVRRGMAIVPTLAPLEGKELEIAIHNLRRFISANGRVIYGTDLGDLGPQPGIDPLETTRMAAAGMSVVDIIASATVRSADWLGLEDRGIIEPGRRADIVGFRDLSLDSLSQAKLVMRRGVVVRNR